MLGLRHLLPLVRLLVEDRQRLALENVALRHQLAVRQGTVENVFFRYKSIIGNRLRARAQEGQETEVVIACNILNRMTELGRPASYAIGA